MKEQLTNNY